MIELISLEEMTVRYDFKMLKPNIYTEIQNETAD